jgi:DNA recombination protein RmuC
MSESIVMISISLNVVSIVLLTMLFFKKTGSNQGNYDQHFILMEKALEKIDRSMREEMSQNRKEIQQTAKQNREEMAETASKFNRMLLSNMADMSTQQKNLLDSFAKQLSDLTGVNEKKLETIRVTVEGKLSSLQEENSKKLEEMRMTVDEKLHSTLEKRLGESFKLVGERLELVHKGLGEMQQLASGVGDLKKVLTNVKTRGTLGEIQLENLLEQMLSFEQYEKNVATKTGSAERVEFAVKLPNHDEEGSPVWLPIDSKFPLEDYQRLLEAQELGDLPAASDALKQLEAKIKNEAKSIRDKYINPPHTTDFAIMFLPIEGLFAEVLRRTGLWDTLQRDYRVVVTGPTTLSAFLNSLQMGFRTLAIQKHSSEVWQVLGAVKTEFGKFGDVLARTKKKLVEATNTMEQAEVRTRAIERQLRNVEELPASAETTKLLPELDLASSE